MAKVKLTILESNCRGDYCKKGDTYIVEDLCPPICHELWHSIYPFVYALQNGASLDYGNGRAKAFDAFIWQYTRNSSKILPINKKEKELWQHLMIL